MHSARSEPEIAPSKRDRGDHLTDNRSRGDWQTRYPGPAWAWIAIEFGYLVAGLLVSLAFLYQIAIAAHPANGPAPWAIAPNRFSRQTLALGAITIGGVCGGYAFAMKWLYHGVAYGKWHRDRLVWRLVVPLLSGAPALFTALMIGSGFIPVFNARIAEGPRIGAAYGFFVGFFSDNLLAALQRLADQTLGTLGRVEEKQARQSEER